VGTTASEESLDQILVGATDEVVRLPAQEAAEGGVGPHHPPRQGHGGHADRRFLEHAPKALAVLGHHGLGLGLGRRRGFDLLGHGRPRGRRQGRGQTLGQLADGDPLVDEVDRAQGQGPVGQALGIEPGEHDHARRG